MTKTSQDPRDAKCTVNQWEKHRWSRAFKDTISKDRFVHILRCRYCARYVCIDFKRTVLPSGRVTVTERVFATEKLPMVDEATVELHEDKEVNDALESVLKSAASAINP